MSPVRAEGQARRRERLTAIADQFTEMIHETVTAAQLAGRDSVSRYAAVTSEGSPESTYAANGNLIVAETTDDLAVRLAREIAEGWPTHGRVWDLDGDWDPWGNLTVVHRVELRPEPDGDPAASSRRR
ncbi:MAG TPA: hypothetical protein VHA80_03275 [Solirubrobacterales bacterium]|nr:hypothetical protein [Solirubrobacterales bacterium]